MLRLTSNEMFCGVSICVECAFISPELVMVEKCISG